VSVLSATDKMVDITRRDSSSGCNYGITLGINLRWRPRLIPVQAAPPPFTTGMGGSPRIPDSTPHRVNTHRDPRGASG
jgi:hypothetical protein